MIDEYKKRCVEKKSVEKAKRIFENTVEKAKHTGQDTGSFGARLDEVTTILELKTKCKRKMEDSPYLPLECL